jgi:hypothetical protein
MSTFVFGLGPELWPADDDLDSLEFSESDAKKPV